MLENKATKYYGAGRTAQPASCEISSNKLGTVVVDNSGLRPGELLPGSLDNDLCISLPHALSDLPMHRIATVAVEDCTQAVESPTNIDIARRSLDFPFG